MYVYSNANQSVSPTEMMSNLLSQKATPLRRIQCTKYFERSSIEIWRLGRSEYWMVWMNDGCYYGIEMHHATYNFCVEARKVMLKYKLDKNGVF